MKTMKYYQKPEMEIISIETAILLAGSVLGTELTNETFDDATQDILSPEMPEPITDIF